MAQISRICPDLAKKVFEVHGVDAQEAVMLILHLLDTPAAMLRQPVCS